jgi:hypothetical protein
MKFGHSHCHRVSTHLQLINIIIIINVFCTFIPLSSQMFAYAHCQTLPFHAHMQWRTEVGGWVFKPPPLPPEIPKFYQSWAEFPVPWNIHPNNLIRIWVSFICKLSGTPDQGATAPRCPFSLPSIIKWICWTPPKKNSWARHCLHVSVRNT